MTSERVSWNVLYGDKRELARFVLKGWRRSAASQRLPHVAATARGLLRGMTKLLTVEHPDFPRVVVGWCLYTPISTPVVHYFYVRQEARRAGAASALLSAAGVPRGELVTTLTGKLPAQVREWFPTITLIDPTIIMREERNQETDHG